MTTYVRWKMAWTMDHMKALTLEIFYRSPETQRFDLNCNIEKEDETQE